MSASAVRIYDIMACDVYWDFDTPLPREQHKFLVSFHPTPGTPTPELIERITARGPGGYEVTFANEKFTGRNLNGWIYDGTLDYYWYMVNLATGFLPEGEYTIEVVCKDGTVLTRSRVQDSAPSRDLVAAYREHRETLLASFTTAADAPLDQVRCGWRTLKDLAGPDTYAIFRLAEGSSVAEFDTQRLVWWDNIFIRRARGTDPEAGLNRGGVTVGTGLKPATDYGWFVELTDANAQGETNICVFQPHRFFRTP
ncbi:hypothetical protein [Streptomyces aidingensis]|uniref:Uncharacterized protein n=1 Tax=Streptomyces aidingensis TaxID=910347 RepID=A0A1I1JA09_9ACTN|nr:hypothetical protein [Streptomyces aidingensis]SFC45417.1 hypothetical protein SAMN05421773_103339 [Streptomyces aidingensis]